MGGAVVGEVIPKWPMIIPIPSPKPAKIDVTIAILEADHDITVFRNSVLDKFLKTSESETLE